MTRGREDRRRWQRLKLGKTAQTVTLATKRMFFEEYRYDRSGVARLGRLKEDAGNDAVRGWLARSTPGTCTDHPAKVADGTWNRADIARFSRPWRLRCLLSAGRSAHQMRASGGCIAAGTAGMTNTIFAG